jgi:hypothetical protein
MGDWIFSLTSIVITQLYRTLMMFNIFTAQTLRVFIKKIFSVLANFKTSSQITIDELRICAPRNRRHLPSAF